MAAVQRALNMDLDVTAPPTPHQERSFSQTLKRTASTASLLSPPASVRKPSTKRLRAQLANESDNESIHGDYLGRGKKAAVTRPKTRSTKRKVVAVRGAAAGPAERNDLNFIPVLDKNLTLPEPEAIQHQLAPRPSTPPPRVCVPVPAPVCPQTPPRTRLNGRRASRVCREAPLRDSPNNPFLVEPCSPPAIPRPRPKRSAADFTEGPTVGYVFRGVPTVFANPYANQHPPSPSKDKDHPSFLPLEHPDFSPCELTRPQLLFPEAHGYAREGSPCPCLPPSTPKRGRARAPRTPVRRSQRNQPVMMEADQACVPKTPEPKTPPTRMRLRGAPDAAVAGEVRMKTRSKTATRAGKV